MTASGMLKRLATWTLLVRADDIPETAVMQAKLLLLDTIGCGFAALDERSAQAVLRMVESAGGAPQCAVIGHTLRTSAANAVLANGALIRVLDLNDYVIANGGEIGGHPSDNIPVALAAGELYGRAGREIIAAIVVGYDLYQHVKTLMGDISAWDGVTASGAVAPAMAGRLMGLDRRQLAHAMALSLAYDHDLAYERRDLERYFGLYRYGPDGIFLKRGKQLRVRLQGAPPFLRLIKAPDPRADRLYFGKALLYPLVAAPFVRVLGLNGLLVLHVLLLFGVCACGHAFLAARSRPGPALLFTLAFVALNLVPSSKVKGR